MFFHFFFKYKKANKLKETVRLFRQPRERQGTFHFNIQVLLTHFIFKGKFMENQFIL